MVFYAVFDLFHDTVVEPYSLFSLVLSCVTLLPWFRGQDWWKTSFLNRIIPSFMGIEWISNRHTHQIQNILSKIDLKKELREISFPSLKIFYVFHTNASCVIVIFENSWISCQSGCSTNQSPIKMDWTAKLGINPNNTNLVIFFLKKSDRKINKCIEVFTFCETLQFT